MLSTTSHKIKVVLFSVWLVITTLLANACGKAAHSILSLRETQVTVTASAPR